MHSAFYSDKHSHGVVPSSRARAGVHLRSCESGRVRAQEGILNGNGFHVVADTRSNRGATR
jgi:hypothetical protein